MYHFITRFSLFIMLILPLLFVVPAASHSAHEPAPIVPLSTLSNVGFYPITSGGTTSIAVAACASVANFQFRSEQTGVFLSQIFQRSTICPPSLAGSWQIVVGAVPGECFTIYAFATETALADADFMARAARYSVCVTGLGTLSAPQQQMVSAPTGVVDAPAASASIQGTVTVSGWAIDAASWNGTGVDQVQIYDATRSPAKLLGTATYGQARADVASAYGDSRYTNAGYTFQLNTASLTNGAATIRVHYHSTVSGLWSDVDRAVTINNPPNPAIHQDTQLRGAVENGTTTIWLKVCGTGQQYRFRSFEITTGKVLWDGTYGTINGCSPEYRAVMGAVTNDTFRFYTTVMNTTLSDADFLQRRRDACRVYSPGVIRCLAGDTPPPPPNATPVDPPTIPTIPPGTPDVPFFWQAEDEWKKLTLPCTCTPLPNTIGSCGCAITSVAMIFRYYGANITPASLLTCAGSNACPMYWGAKPPLGCGGGTAKLQSFDFSWSWSRLETELRNGPVVLDVRGHFVVVLSGSGSDGRNYRVNDPGVSGGKNMALSDVLARGYTPQGMRIYRGTPSPIPVALSEEVTPSNSLKLAAGEVITGTVDLYRNTETTMTLAFSATSAAGSVTDIQVWTDTNQTQEWQPYYPYGEIPLAKQYYARFRDAVGNVSPILSAGTTVVPPSIEGRNLYLPLIAR